MTAPNGDGLPWYRHVWPWFIVVLLTIAVGASVATVVVAFRGQDPVVRDDWYADGLAINRSLERLERARQQGIRAELQFARDVDEVSVMLQGQGVEALDHLLLVLSHATRSQQDRSVRLTRVAPGRFDGALAAPAEGRYYVTLEPAVAGPSVSLGEQPAWRLSRAFYAGASSSIVLGDGG